MVNQPTLFDAPHFDGVTYDPAKDHDRLTKQLGRVYNAMRFGAWWSLPELANATGDPQASISARIRDLRKHKFGGYEVERRRRDGGLYEYRIVV